MGKNITIQKILGVLLHRLPIILIAGFFMALVFYLYTSIFVKPVYNASAILYVQNFGKQHEQGANDQQSTTTAANGQTKATSPNKVTDDPEAASNGEKKSLGNSSESNQSNNALAEKIFASDMAASATLAQNCIIMFQNTPEVKDQYMGCGVTMTTIEDSFYIKITASGKDADKVKVAPRNIVNACSEVFGRMVAYGKLEPVSVEKTATATKPNKMQNAIIGGVIGVIIACVISILLELIDTTIKHDDDLSDIYKIPVFAEIPDFESSNR